MGSLDETENYAVVQHEDTSLNHPHGGEAKFLEKALNSHAGRKGLAIAARIGKAAFRAGKGAQAARMPQTPNEG